jgi:hypothetical protein
MVSILFLLLMFMPIWSVAWVCQRLGTLTEPTLRRDIAMTPQDARGFLWGKLRKRFFIAGVPPLLFAVSIPLMNFVGVVLERDTYPIRWDLVWVEGVVGLAIPLLCITLLPVLGGWSCLLAAAHSACRENRQFSVWNWGPISTGVGCFVALLWYVGAYRGMSLLPGGSVNRKLMYFVVFFLVFFAAVSFVLRSQWKRFVSAYLEVEGGAAQGDPS